jgi:hypothetical protein
MSLKFFSQVLISEKKQVCYNTDRVFICAGISLTGILHFPVDGRIKGRSVVQETDIPICVMVPLTGFYTPGVKRDKLVAFTASVSSISL